MEYKSKKTKKDLEIKIIGPLSFKDTNAFFPVLTEIKNYLGLKLIFDMSECSFIDSAGIGMLIISAKEAAPKNLICEIKGASKAIKELLTIAKIGNFYKFVN